MPDAVIIIRQTDRQTDSCLISCGVAAPVYEGNFKINDEELGTPLGEPSFLSFFCMQKLFVKEPPMEAAEG